MKVTELMIGDWIEDGYKKAQVTSITCDGIVETTAAISNIEVVDPIPLTEEILVKNGFEKNHNDEAPAEECYFYRLFAKPCGWFDIDAFGLEEELGAEFTYHDININYVHQLQHLLRLCGIDKEISI